MKKVHSTLFCVKFIVIVCLNVIEAHYTQQWAVHIEGGAKIADEVARDHGFINHGVVSRLIDTNNKFLFYYRVHMTTNNLIMYMKYIYIRYKHMYYVLIVIIASMKRARKK